MKEIKICAVCGFGIGSSLILKMQIEDVLKSHQIEANVEAWDLNSFVSEGVDFVFASSEISDLLNVSDNTTLVTIDDFLDKKKVEYLVLKYIH